MFLEILYLVSECQIDEENYLTPHSTCFTYLKVGKNSSREPENRHGSNNKDFAGCATKSVCPADQLPGHAGVGAVRLFIPYKFFLKGFNDTLLFGLHLQNLF